MLTTSFPALNLLHSETRPTTNILGVIIEELANNGCCTNLSSEHCSLPSSIDVGESDGRLNNLQSYRRKPRQLLQDNFILIIASKRVK